MQFLVIGAMNIIHQIQRTLQAIFANKIRSQCINLIYNVSFKYPGSQAVKLVIENKYSANYTRFHNNFRFRVIKFNLIKKKNSPRILICRIR